MEKTAFKVLVFRQVFSNLFRPSIPITGHWNHTNSYNLKLEYLAIGVKN